VGSRVLGAASACVVASGLFLCALGGALAIADPSTSPEIPGDTHSKTDDPGKGPKTDPDGSGDQATKTAPATKTGPATKTDEKTDTETDKPGVGANPSNGNCGNSGSNGNAQHCGSSSPPSTPSSPSPTPSTAPPTQSPNTTTPPTTTESTSETTSESKTTSTSTSAVGLPAPGGGGGGGGGIEVPSGRPELPPEMQLPPASEPPVIDVVPGVGAAALELPIPPITLPVIVAPAVGLGAGGGPAGTPALPAAPRGVSAEPPAGRDSLPASVGSNLDMPPSSYRIGYTDYLRNAGLSQVAALAVPGVAGMLVLTGAGGLVGYRQAKAGHAVHTSGTARFVN
jgi:hypothetical protein